MNKVTFLGPIGATFSHEAYDILAKTYGLSSSSASQLVPAVTNGEILKMIRGHGGYGAIAMETLAEMRVNDSLESFIGLLKFYKNVGECPFRIIGAIALELNFCLMKRKGGQYPWKKLILAHPKAIGACRANIEKNLCTTMDCSSNGEAARLVAESEKFKDFAALGPRSAVERFGLELIRDHFEDKLAVTTFFLIGPKKEVVNTTTNNRVLIVFDIPHESGSLVRALTPFEKHGLNLIQIHSAHSGNNSYSFAIEIEIGLSKFKSLEKALKMFEKTVSRHLIFGPFGLIDV